MSFSVKTDPERNVMDLNGSPVSLHCHHYNCGLLDAIEQIPNIDGHRILIETAAEEFYRNFRRYLAEALGKASEEFHWSFRNCSSDALREAAIKAAFEDAVELYRLMGFGRLNFNRVSGDGGIVYADSSYYVVSWLAKYGRRATPVCYLTCGFIAGILGVIFDAGPYAYEVTETQCMIQAADVCEFAVIKRPNGN
jgi:predicted hydrocarbon binding protein